MSLTPAERPILRRLFCVLFSQGSDKFFSVSVFQMSKCQFTQKILNAACVELLPLDVCPGESGKFTLAKNTSLNTTQSFSLALIH